jgi:nicotinamide mononucleotide transporter
MDWLTEHYIEIFGALTGIIYVFLEIRQNIWLWPLGIVTSAVYIYVFYNTGFYADMGLQWYYLFISVYGWIIWSRAKKIKNAGSREEGGGSKEEANEEAGSKLPISRISLSLGLSLIMVTTIVFFIIWLILIRFTDSTIPGWDAFTTALSVTAMWMLARKIIEHWYLWILVNIVSIGLYIYKGLYPTVILFIVYAVMAIIGYLEWKKEIK